MRAAVAQRGIKHRRGRTLLIKNVRAVLKNAMITSSFLHFLEINSACRQYVELPIFF